VRDFMVGFRAAFPDLNFWLRVKLPGPTRHLQAAAERARDRQQTRVQV